MGSRFRVLVLGLPAIWLLVVGWTHRSMSEDGFIYLRVVRQIRAGNGPVFNAGERVEAYTGVLWVGVLTVLDVLVPVRLEWISVVLGLLLSASGVMLAVLGARRLSPPAWRDDWFVPLGATVVVAVFPVWAYATSGLETGLVFAWLGACTYLLARWADDGRMLGRGEAVVIGLGWLVRPELVLFSAAFVAVVLLAHRRDGRRACLRLAVWALALPVAYQLFRMAYFGGLVANTAVAKEGLGSQRERGLHYLWDLVDPYVLWLPLIGLVAAGYAPLLARSEVRRSRRRLAVGGAFVGAALVNAAFVVSAGGDYHHGRLLLPVLFALCAPVAAVPVRRSHLAGVGVAVWAAIAVVTLRPEQYDGNPFANDILAPRGFGRVTVEDHGWGPGGERRKWFDGQGGSGLFVEDGLLAYARVDDRVVSVAPDPTVAAWGIGVLGYSVGPEVRVLDLLGLAEPLAAHLEPTPTLPGRDDRFPGHEKPLPAPWLAALVTERGTRPAAELFPVFGSPLIEPTTGPAFDEQVAWARAALRCGPIARLTVSADGAFTPKRAIANLARSFEQTTLRIPPDPETAYRRFCGDGTPPDVAALRRSRER